MIANLKSLIKWMIWCCGCLMPKNRHKIVFGAWVGKSYADTAKYLFQYFFDKPDYTVVWIGDAAVRAALPPLPKNAKFAVKGSLLSWYHAATAKFWTYTHSPHGDICPLPLFGRAVFLNLNHGIGLKRFGSDCPCNSKNSSIQIGTKSFFLQPPVKIDNLLHSNHIQAEAVKQSYPQFTDAPIMPFGLPTVDWMMHVKGNRTLAREYKAKFAAMFGLPLDKRWFVYAPTFRWTVKDNFSFANISDVTQRDLLRKTLESQNAIIVEKLHPRVLSEGAQIAYDNQYVYGIGGEKARLIEPLELWFAADFIISDYSSVALSGHLMGIPVVHFAYDLDFYANQDSGLLFPLDEMNVGPIAQDVPKLCRALNNDKTLKWQIGSKVSLLLEWEHGRSCEQLIEFMSKAR